MFDFCVTDLRVYCDSRGHFVWRDFPSFAAVMLYRFGHWGHTRKYKVCRLAVNLLYFPLCWIVWIATGIQIPKSTTIGKGFRIHHWGSVIINGAAIIGENCQLRPGVIIGNLHDGNDVPVIGDNVSVGGGGKILGAIHVGNNVKVGANAVVVKDVPDNATAVGVPARIILK